MSKRNREIAELALNQLSHETDLPRVKLRDKLVKFANLPASHIERDIHEIPLDPQGFILQNIPDERILPEPERTYVQGRDFTIQS